MPFEVQADGPTSIFGFSSANEQVVSNHQRGRSGISIRRVAVQGAKYPVRPGTTVSRIFTATTFFTNRVKPVLQQQVRRNRRGNPERE